MHAPGTGAITDTATAGIEAGFPGWRVWRSRGHQGQPAGWWASRRHAAVWAEPQTIAADTEAQLRAALTREAAESGCAAL